MALADTPGHVDFSYEVSRSLAACRGALLLVDAAQGVQAQTVATFFLAFEQNIAIVPVLNKMDMPTAEPERVVRELEEAFAISPADCIFASAKQGTGTADILRALVERVPPPGGAPDAPLRMLLFDAHHNPFRGVISLFQVVDGSVRVGDRIESSATGEVYDVMETGLLTPGMTPW